MKNLSKSKLVSFNQCPKKLWLEINKYTERVDSAQSLANFVTGNKVGEIAQQLYDVKGDGTLIDPFTEGWPSAFRRTKELINGDKPIFEATFSGNGALALADVMLPAENACWDMIEVKSSTKVKDYHELDISIQMFAATAANIKLNSVALACIDNSWVYQGDGDYQGLLYETDLTDLAESNQQKVALLVSSAQAVASQREEPDIDIGDHCSDPFDCGFYSYCTRNHSIAEHPVSWLPRKNNATKEFIASNGIVEMDQVPNDLLNDEQLRVKQSTLSGETYFDKEGAKQVVANHDLPLCFIDFETVNPAIPLWAGCRPYQQIPYQFSNHTIDGSGEITHKEFLDISGNDPRRDFASNLIETCATEGAIYVYNIGFERGIILNLAEQFNDLADDLTKIANRFVDLLPVAQQHYYHPSMHGSWSIKKLLPVIAPQLDYSQLEGVKDGGMAMEVFYEAVDSETTEDRKNEIGEQLLKYCELDTYAMVVIWGYFAGVELA